jgi:hypothetical protein
MNRPPLPAALSAKRTRRPEQNLPSLAPGPRGVVLLPVIPKIPQSESWIWVKPTYVPVKVVRISSCTSIFSFAFTLSPRNLWERNGLQSPPLKSAREKIHQNGWERPHFFGLQPPKKFLGSLPPVLFRSRMHEQLCRAEGEPVVENAVHPSRSPPCSLHYRGYRLLRKQLRSIECAVRVHPQNTELGWNDPLRRH